nr:MAG TPA: hypothetical protein [Caudoviricetes sp.]
MVMQYVKLMIYFMVKIVMILLLILTKLMLREL